MDSIGIENLTKMLSNEDKTIENIDLNKPMPQFIFFLIAVLTWPLFLFYKDY